MASVPRHQHDMGNGMAQAALARINFGKQLRNRRIFKDDVVEAASIDEISPRYRPCYTGKDVFRYVLTWSGLACLNDDEARCGGCWDAAVQNAHNKIVTRQIGRYPSFALDRRGYQCLNTMFMITLHSDAGHDLHYVLGVLNSSLLEAIWVERFYDRRRTFPKIKGSYLKQLPIRMIGRDNPDDLAKHDRIVELVQSILDMNERLHGEGGQTLTPQERRVLERRIASTDREIDRLVYELYGLTDEEIAIVEEATTT